MKDEGWLDGSLAVAADGALESNHGPTPLTEQSMPIAAAPARSLVNTRFLLFLAVLLVVNSHLEAFYPRAFLAGDGLIGYALFFFVSGLGVALSTRRSLRPFGEYYYRRIARIYPTLWLAVVPEALLTGAIFAFTPLDYVRAFIWPTHNTFVGPLMVDYGLLYLVLRAGSPRVMLGTIAALVVPCAYIWFQVGHLGSAIFTDSLGVWLPRIANLEALLMGAYFGLRVSAPTPTFLREIGLFLATLGVYIPFRYAMQTGWHPELFAALYLLTYVMLIGLARLACSSQLGLLMQRFPRVAAFIELLGLCCLEIYFMHSMVIAYLPIAEAPFPLNIAVLWAIVIPTAYLLQRVATSARGGFRTFSWRID